MTSTSNPHYKKHFVSGADEPFSGLVWRSQPSALARASGSKPILHLSPAAEILQSNEIAGYVIPVCMRGRIQ